MSFGNDGKLYVATGDGRGTQNGQRKLTVLGKLIRLNDDGSIPDDNPFTTENGYEAYDCRESEGKVPASASADGVCAEIYATGLRNPFRISKNPNIKNKSVFAISDVGVTSWEELSFAGTDFPGVNYGFNVMEGPCLRNSAVDCPVDDTFEDPFHFYQHREGRDGCVAGNVFVPDDIGWPEAYKFLFIDFVFYEIYSLTEDPDQACRTCIPPISGYRNETFHTSIWYPGDHKDQARMLDLFFGPYKDEQALYVIRYGSYDTVLRIRYTGIFNDPPVVDFAFEEKFYDVGDAVKFNGSLTTDTEGDKLTFKWFFGDGGTSLEVSPTHVYLGPGQYEVSLIVVDEMNQEQQRSRPVVVGTPPTANILSPLKGDQFSVGQVLRLKGEAFYADGTAFNESLLEWEVRKHHDDHYHPFLDVTTGNDFDLYPAPEPEDIHASLNSYIEIILRATDDYGLTTEVNRLVQPTLVMVAVDSNPTGLTITVEDEPLVAYEEVWSWEEHDLHLNADDQLPHVFQSWSDGVTDRKRVVRLNYSDPVFVANFCVVDDGPCPTGSSACCSGDCCGGKCVTTNASCVVTDGNDAELGTNIPEEPEGSNPSAPPGGKEPHTRYPVEAPTDSPMTLVTNSPSSLRPIGTSSAQDSTSESASQPSMGTAGKALLSISVLAAVGLIAVFVFTMSRSRSGPNVDDAETDATPAIAVTKTASSHEKSATVGDVSSDGSSGQPEIVPIR